MAQYRGDNGVQIFKFWLLFLTVLSITRGGVSLHLHLGGLILLKNGKCDILLNLLINVILSAFNFD